jgi:hypothetical protein
MRQEVRSTISPLRSSGLAGQGWTQTRFGPRSCRDYGKPCPSTRCGGRPRTRRCFTQSYREELPEESGPFFVEQPRRACRHNSSARLPAPRDRR